MRIIQTYLVSVVIILGAITPLQEAGAWGRFDGGHHPDHAGHWAHVIR